MMTYVHKSKHVGTVECIKDYQNSAFVGILYILKNTVMVIQTFSILCDTIHRLSQSLPL
jgi:hypothetical protein